MTGDVGGDTGVGTSASSSSSSSHSSSLRGVMLFPSHTEWIDTFNRQGHWGHGSGARRQVPRPRVLSCRCGGVLCTEPTPVTWQGPFSPRGPRAEGPTGWGWGISHSSAAGLKTWNEGSGGRRRTEPLGKDASAPQGHLDEVPAKNGSRTRDFFPKLVLPH